MRFKKYGISGSLLIAYILILVGVTCGLGIVKELYDKYTSIRQYRNEELLNTKSLLFNERSQIDCIDELMYLVELFPAEYKTIQFKYGPDYIVLVFAYDELKEIGEVSSSDVSVIINDKVNYGIGDTISIDQYDYVVKSVVQDGSSNRNIYINWNNIDENRKKNMMSLFGRAINNMDGGYIDIRSDDRIDDEEEALIEWINNKGIEVHKVEKDRGGYYFKVLDMVFSIVILFGVIYCVLSNIAWMSERRMDYIVRRLLGYRRSRQYIISLANNLLNLFVSLPVSLLIIYYVISNWGRTIEFHVIVNQIYISLIGVIIISSITIWIIINLFYKKCIIEVINRKKDRSK